MSRFVDMYHMSAHLSCILGEIWLFPKHTRIIKQFPFWWLQAQSKHIGEPSFALEWAVL